MLFVRYDVFDYLTRDCAL